MATRHALFDVAVRDPLIPNMEVDSQPNATPSDATNRRRSARTVQKPVLFQQDPNIPVTANGSAKRKRAERDAPASADALGPESSSDHAESEADAEETKEKRRRTAKSSKARDKATKKNVKAADSDGMKLAMRPATNGVKPAKPRKPATKKRLPQLLGDDLYGMRETARGTSLALTLLRDSLWTREVPRRGRRRVD